MTLHEQESGQDRQKRYDRQRPEWKARQFAQELEWGNAHDPIQPNESNRERDHRSGDRVTLGQILQEQDPTLSHCFPFPLDDVP
jgi:hypothetical protein